MHKLWHILASYNSDSPVETAMLVNFMANGIF